MSTDRSRFFRFRAFWLYGRTDHRRSGWVAAVEPTSPPQFLQPVPRSPVVQTQAETPAPQSRSTAADPDVRRSGARLPALPDGIERTEERRSEAARAALRTERRPAGARVAGFGDPAAGFAAVSPGDPRNLRPRRQRPVPSASQLRRPAARAARRTIAAGRAGRPADRSRWIPMLRSPETWAERSRWGCRRRNPRRPPAGSNRSTRSASPLPRPLRKSRPRFTTTSRRAAAQAGVYGVQAPPPLAPAAMPPAAPPATPPAMAASARVAAAELRPAVRDAADVCSADGRRSGSGRRSRAPFVPAVPAPQGDPFVGVPNTASGSASAPGGASVPGRVREAGPATCGSAGCPSRSPARRQHGRHSVGRCRSSTSRSRFP